MDHYHVLGLADRRRRQAPRISPHELRQAYRRALLAQHPDKHRARASPSSVAAATAAATATIDDIAEAYRVLSDPALKAEYDRELGTRQPRGHGADHATRHAGMETVDLADLDFQQHPEQWSRRCRCGSEPAFVVTEAELEQNVESGELITGCKGCSLWLKVLFSVEA